MSSISIADRQYLESALRMSRGNVLTFTDETFSDFFNELKVNIDDDIYRVTGTSKANRLRVFIQVEDNMLVGRALIGLATYLRNMELAGQIYKHIGFSDGVTKIGEKLITMQQQTAMSNITQASVTNNQIKIEIRPEIYKHIKRYLDTNDYFHAVEESYKIVRSKLFQITDEEQAHKAFANENYEKIFGHKPKNETEADFFEGIKFLHMALQKFRNEKVHSPANDLDKNLAIHYISLASLAYDLILKSNAE